MAAAAVPPVAPIIVMFELDAESVMFDPAINETPPDDPFNEKPGPPIPPLAPIMVARDCAWEIVILAPATRERLLLDPTEVSLDDILLAS